MRVLWHFIKRDILDFRIGWSLLILVHVVLLVTRASADRLQWIWSVYFMFALFYASGVWNSGAGVFQGINRTSLRSLPIRRRTMFLYTVLRCMVGTAPFVIYLFWMRSHSASLFKVVWISSLGTDLYLAVLLVFSAAFMAITNTSDTMEVVHRAVGRWYRLRVVIVMMVEGIFGMGMQVMWVVAGCGLLYARTAGDYTAALSTMGVALVFHTFLGWRRYQQWCWD